MGSSYFNLSPGLSRSPLHYHQSSLAVPLTMSKTGTIKKFFEDKGFGFVSPDDGSDDVFVHVKDNAELEGCEAGDTVTFDSEYDDRKGKYKGVNLSCKSRGGGGGGGGGGYGKGDSKGKGKGSPYGGGW